MDQNINLLSTLPSPQKTYLPAKLLVQIVCYWVLFLLIIFFIKFGMVFNKGSELNLLSQQKEQMLNKIAPLDKQFALTGGATKTPSKINEFIKQKNNCTNGFSNYLKALAETTPDGIWLTEIKIAQDNNSIYLFGSAISPSLLPEFLSALNKSEIFATKKFSNLEIVKPENFNNVNFSLNNIVTLSNTTEKAEDKPATERTVK